MVASADEQGAQRRHQRCIARRTRLGNIQASGSAERSAAEWAAAERGRKRTALCCSDNPQRGPEQGAHVLEQRRNAAGVGLDIVDVGPADLAQGARISDGHGWDGQCDIFYLVAVDTFTGESAQRLPGLNTGYMSIVLPPRGCGMFITRFARPPREDSLDSRCAELRAPDMEDHLFWALIAHRETFGTTRALRQLTPAELQDVALGTIHDWAPALQRLVAGSDPHSFTTIALQSGDEVPAWDTVCVTLRGDAIHTMTPLQGLGGNTALRDASVLTRALVQVDRGQTDLVAALRTYEASMRAYGSRAVRVSLQYTRLFVSHSRLARAAFAALLLGVDRVPLVNVGCSAEYPTWHAPCACASHKCGSPRSHHPLRRCRPHAMVGQNAWSPRSPKSWCGAVMR